MIDRQASGSPRARTVFLVLLAGLAAQALKPAAPIERALGFLFAPARALAEVAAPLRWLASGEVRAAERALDEAEEETRARALALVADEQDAALPRDPALRAGRRFVHGEVRGRVDGALDSVVVHLATRAGVQPGMPVVSGEHFVGRVDRFDAQDPRAVVVRLVTARDSFVGAVLVDEEGDQHAAFDCELVVGGLAATPPGAPSGLYLAVHNPSRRAFGGGRVVVRELLAEDFAELADDYTLGQLVVRRSDGRAGAGEPQALRAGIDFESGLFHVLVVLPADEGPSEERLALETFDPRAWLVARALAPGDLSPARHALRVALPLGHRVRPGAALAHGFQLVGRVAAVDPASADVQRLGDRGLRFAALARVEGEAAPYALGALVSLGERDADGAQAFRWDAPVPVGAPGDAPRAAQVFTGSGEPGVPRGLLVGRTELPAGPGPHVLRVTPDPATEALARGLIWVGARAPAGEDAP